MTELLPPSLQRSLALVWALLVLACGLHLASTWLGGRLAIDTDVMSLLPHDARNHSAEAALEQLSAGASRRVLLVIAGNDRARVRHSADAIRQLLDSDHSPLQPLAGSDSALADLLSFYSPYRDRLLTRGDRQRLRDSAPEQIAQQMLQSLFRPGIGLRALGPADDPTGSFSIWLQQLASASRVRPDEGMLALQTDDRYLLLLPYELSASALSVATLEQLQPLLQQARELATTAGVELLTAGIPVHAAAATAQAATEMSTIGLGAGAGIALMMLLCFRSVRPMVLVLATVAIGLVVALSISLLVFERVHLITLVFGASLVGVAEDYAIHYLSAQALSSPAEHRRLIQRLRPGLLLAFATSALGYLALAMAPFPGLKQMALFSIVGLFAALISVLLWFPALCKSGFRASALSIAIARSRRHWPQLRGPWLAFALLAALLSLAGLSKLSVRDDLRTLQSSPPELIEQQTQIAQWLGEPSPAQFYLVRAPNAESLLQREEALTERLELLADEGFIDGHRALSDWVPSQQRQARDQALLVAPSTAVLALLDRELGPFESSTVALAHAPLQLSAWLASPLSTAMRPLYLGSLDGALVSVVQVSGLHSPAQLQRLAATAEGLEGVSWVDKIADYSGLLHDYRLAMSWVLGASFLLIYLMLLPRFGRRAWRVLMPTACGLIAVLAWLGWRGEALQLFHVLGLTVMLGMCVDYGIFLCEPGDDQAPWLAVVLGAVNTLLAFGLLAFSQTPALAAFGSTLLIGISVAWLVAPMICRPEAGKPSDPTQD